MLAKHKHAIACIVVAFAASIEPTRLTMVGCPDAVDVMSPTLNDTCEFRNRPPAHVMAAFDAAFKVEWEPVAVVCCRFIFRRIAGM